jgi:hypothetical protein
MYITVYKTVIHLQTLSQEKVIHGFSNYLLVILFYSILCNIVKKFAPILPLYSIGHKKATFRKKYLLLSLNDSMVSNNFFKILDAEYLISIHLV